jgi:hypothetical protein
LAHTVEIPIVYAAGVAMNHDYRLAGAGIDVTHLGVVNVDVGVLLPFTLAECLAA